METESKGIEEVAASVEMKKDETSAKQEDRMRRFHRTMNVNKKIVVIAVLIIVLSILYSYRGFFIAATVDGNLISRWSVIQELEKKSGEQALDTLVVKQLINAAAKQAGAVPSPLEVDQEIKKITEQIEKQGGTLALALEQQGMTESEFRDQIILQKNLEKILGDKVVVTDEDVASYMTQNKVAIPKGTDEEIFKNQVREKLKGQKFNAEASQWVTDARAKAKINYFVDYAPKPISAEELPAEGISSEPKQ